MNNSVNTTLKFGRPWWQSYHVDMQQDGAVVKTYIPAAGIDSRENLGQSQALGLLFFWTAPGNLAITAQYRIYSLHCHESCDPSSCNERLYVILI